MICTVRPSSHTTTQKQKKTQLLAPPVLNNWRRIFSFTTVCLIAPRALARSQPAACFPRIVYLPKLLQQATYTSRVGRVPLQPRQACAPARAPPSASCSTSDRPRVYLNYYSVYVSNACAATRFGEASGGCAELHKLFRIPFYSSCSVPATELHTNIIFSV